MFLWLLILKVSTAMDTWYNNSEILIVNFSFFFQYITRHLSTYGESHQDKQIIPIGTT